MSKASQGLNLEDWHRRYQQQAQWTQHIRQHLLTKAEADFSDQVLEVGSGTGAVLEQLAQAGYQHLTGIDIDHPSLVLSQQFQHPFYLVQADGHCLPFPNDTFAISVCHYLLLWVRNPVQLLAEMHRVTRPGGCVIALAEPDHQSRIDTPPPLDKLGEYQTQALHGQGADIAMGRKLKQLFRETGLGDVTTGILGAEWTGEQTQTIGEPEWMMIRADLAGRLSEAELSAFQSIDRTAWEAQNRVLFIPTFYAIGFA